MAPEDHEHRPEAAGPAPGDRRAPRGRQRVFLSYARADATEFVDSLARDLEPDYEVILDRKFMQSASGSWSDQIEISIDTSRMLIAVLSPFAVRRTSDGDSPDGRDSICHKEIQQAFNANMQIIPVMCKRCHSPFLLNDVHYIDFEDLGYPTALAKLRTEIEEVLSGKPVSRKGIVLDDWSLALHFHWVKQERADFYGRRWLLDDLDTWRRERSSERVFLVTGTPGTGKSSITVRLAKDDQPCGPVFAYHFCIRNKTADALSFVHNVSYMLAQRLPSYSEAVARLPGSQELSELPAGIFFDRAILAPLHAIAPPSEARDQPGWILVDALDEASDAADGEASIAALIEDNAHRLPAWLRFLVTSRPGAIEKGLEERIENGQALVRQISLDGHTAADDALDCIRERFAAAGRPMPSAALAAMIQRRCNNNFLYLTLLLNRLLAGEWTEDDIARAPPGLDSFYTKEFSRLFPKPDGEAYRRIRPLLSVILAAREQLSAELLGAVVGMDATDVIGELEKVAAYLIEKDRKYSIYHKSLDDWLLDRKRARGYALDETDGHKRLAQFAMRIVEDWPGKFDIAKFEGDETREYVMRYGISHCVAAGELALAIELLHFAAEGWDEEKAARSSFASISPDRVRRTVLLALKTCGNAQRRAINPQHLAVLIKDFYQVEPLGPALNILIASHAAAWPAIMKTLLAAENYVLRFRMSDMLAETSDDIDAFRALLDDPDINVHELGAYTLRRFYATNPALIRMDDLERMGESETYPARSALGDLLLNLTFQGIPVAAKLKSPAFWQPVWDHNRLDVWDLTAAEPFLAGRPLPDGADAGTRDAYRNFTRTGELRRRLLDDPQVRDDKAILAIVSGFNELGRDPDQVGEAEEALGTSPLLGEVMRLLFAHPLWNVAEGAASALTSIIEGETDKDRDGEKKRIVTDLFEDPYWRVRFGAIETAYQLVSSDNMALFEQAVNRFCDDPNARVRALCAENLVAHIIDRPRRMREGYLKRFERPIARWLADDDCWVLEHVFRLLRTLARDGRDCRALFGPGMPYLLDGISAWGELPRQEFLRHIERRKRAAVTPAT